MKLDLEGYTDLTQTRVRECPVLGCKFNLANIGKAECNLKFIELDESGRCRQFILKLARE